MSLSDLLSRGDSGISLSQGLIGQGPFAENIVPLIAVMSSDACDDDSG